MTNGLYLVLALRLYQATQNPDYRDAASREYNFLDQWFNNGLLLKLEDERRFYDWYLVQDCVDVL